MSTVVIHPRPLSGAVTPPPSKSQAHRLMICAALAGAECDLEGMGESQDIQATRRCLEALQSGASAAEIDGLPILDCGESGSTLRFLIPVALALRGGGRFTGRGRLLERPQSPYRSIFQEKGIAWEQDGGFLTVCGRLAPGRYAVPGNVSSQFITGLLYALPLLDGESELVLTTPLESQNYVSMTLEALGDCGIQVYKRGDRFQVPGRQNYQAAKPLRVEADWSQAAFWYAAEFLGSSVAVEGMDKNSTQGDRVILNHRAVLSRGGDVDIDVSGCPDLAPPLAAMAAVREGTCRLTNAARLRLKESDRLHTIAQTLEALGARVEERADSLTIRGLDHLEGGVTVDCCNDHRIAMMAAVAATRCVKPITLLGAQCVQKSYPQFWDHYRMLGGNLDVLISG